MGPKQAENGAASTVDAAEIAQFAKTAAQWWDPQGPAKPLHKLNPTRIGFLRDRLCAHFGRDPQKPAPLDGLTILDVGCGGGLVCEPLARLGAAVTGIDADGAAIPVARDHAEAMGLTIDYRDQEASALVAAGDHFDAVLALEIVEHVADVPMFLATLRQLVKDQGLLAMSTLNRTAVSFLGGIVAAEYVLRWVPRGTHDWRKFLTPAELGVALEKAGFQPPQWRGMTLDPLADRWRLGDNLAINYIGTACAKM